MRIEFYGSRANTPEDYGVLLDLVVRYNVDFLRRMKASGGDPPCCCECGEIRYAGPTGAERAKGVTRIEGADELLAKRKGSCGSLAAYDVAAAIVEGKRADCMIVGSWPDLHCVVVHDDGTISDPSEGKDDCGCNG